MCQCHRMVEIGTRDLHGPFVIAFAIERCQNDSYNDLSGGFVVL